MKFVFASERQRLIKERKKYVDDYNARKSAHDAQVNQFQTASNNYSADMESFISAFLYQELANFPEAKLEVKKSSENRYTNESDYFIKFSYGSNKRADSKRYSGDYLHNVEEGRYQGFNWSYVIFIRTETKSVYNYDRHDYDRTHTKILNKVPTINANILESEDLEILKKTYSLFAKIETIDWQSILDRINTGVPKESDFITTKDPGRLDTSEYDTAITDYNIARIIGKDIWIRVNITREESYDRWSSYSTNPGVDGVGWIKVSSATPKYYLFNWIEGNGGSYRKQDVLKSLRKTIKMKKIYIKPEMPIMYQSTEDLTVDDEPSITEPQP